MRSLTKPARRASVILASGAAFALLVATGGSAQAAAIPIGLGTADSFVVLAGAGVTNTGTTTLSGDLGAANGSVIGDTDLVFTSGTNHYGDSTTTGAMPDLETAYGSASQPTDVTVSANLGGQGLVAGVYFQSGTMTLSGPALTLDAGGNPDAVWVFRAGSDLIVGPGASVNLINGAQACNVWWQVGSSASIDDGADLVGTVMARSSITLNAGATVQGRVLALDGTVTLITNTITRPLCTTPVSGDTTSGDATTVTGGPGGSGTTSGPTGSTETGSQVTTVPSGGVATGDGSTSLGSFALFLLAAGVVAIGTGAATVAARRRHKWLA